MKIETLHALLADSVACLLHSLFVSVWTREAWVAGSANQACLQGMPFAIAFHMLANILLYDWLSV